MCQTRVGASTLFVVAPSLYLRSCHMACRGVSHQLLLRHVVSTALAHGDGAGGCVPSLTVCLLRPLHRHVFVEGTRRNGGAPSLATSSSSSSASPSWSSSSSSLAYAKGSNLLIGPTAHPQLCASRAPDAECVFQTGRPNGRLPGTAREGTQGWSPRSVWSRVTSLAMLLSRAIVRLASPG